MRVLLNVDYRSLNPENEMKKMFGSRVLHQVAAENAGVARHRHRNANPRSRAKIQHHSIIVPKANWPAPGKTGGLSMKFLDSDAQGNQYFAFEHSQHYQSVEKTFFLAVESLNPDNIVQLLNQNPHHIDSMLQLSDICKTGEDVQMASELIERTLFTMEAAFHPLFNLAVGTSRLEYRRQENRAFFIALFRHLVFIGSRACYRTALEFSKLILNLDPDQDPVGVFLLMDFYAVKARQYQWFLKMYEELEPKKNLSQLPNWAFGAALCSFYSGDPEKADAQLQEALIMFPGALLRLLDKCSIEADSTSKHNFFLEAEMKQTDGLTLLIKLYVGRSFHLWKDADLLPWLEKNVKRVVERVAVKDDLVRKCEEKRNLRYYGAPRNIYRHVVMSGVEDATTSLPKELADAPLMAYDPLPPQDSIDLYTKMSRPTQIDDPSALRLFFRSILPNFNPNDPLPEAPIGEG